MNDVLPAAESETAVNSGLYIEPESDEKTVESEDFSLKQKLLVFSIEKRLFSVDAELVDEIVNDTEVFPLPFVPECVDGVINLRGQPVTVFNPFAAAVSDSEAKPDFKGIKTRTHCNILKFKCGDEPFGIKISCVETFSSEEESSGAEKLDVNKMKSDLRNALGYENN